MRVGAAAARAEADSRRTECFGVGYRVLGLGSATSHADDERTSAPELFLAISVSSERLRSSSRPF